MNWTAISMNDLEAQRLAAVAALRERLEGAAQALRKQADLLRVRGVAPPLHLLNTFTSIDLALNQLARSIEDEAIEIGQLQALAETYAMINSSLDVDTVLAQALDEIIALTGAERGFILLYSPQSDALDLRIARGMDGQADASEMSSTVVREVIATGKPILTNNASRDPALARSDTVARFTLRSILCVPLIARDRVEGAIYVDNRFREGVFTERELTLLTAFANQTAVAVENALLFGQVQAAAREMARAKDLIENVFASIESGVITTDDANTISTLNAAAARILSLHPDQAVGQPIAEVLPRIFSELEPFLTAVRAQRQSFVTEIRTEVPGRGRAALNFKLSPLAYA
ncbi:MAG: GAF domain-containing protein, partial [Anaerolinea sp.]|nr:GAF domain-containing protein [Anaerolinea sp.]